MIGLLGFAVIGVGVSAGLLIPWVLLRSGKLAEESVQQSLASLDLVIEGMNKRIALDEELVAQQQRLVEQGDETIALLSAIKDNLDHRSLKN